MYVLLTLQDGQVNEQVPPVVPTHENNVVTVGFMEFKCMSLIFIT